MYLSCRSCVVRPVRSLAPAEGLPRAHFEASARRFRSFAPFHVLCALLVIVFVLGGGSRGDIASLMILRPVSILLLALGLVTLTREQVREHRFLFAMALLILFFLFAQLVPLPPYIWQNLPGRELVVAIDAAAGLSETWRPLSLDPEGTGNALFAALVPMAALVLGVQLSLTEHERLLWLVLAIGAASGLLGLYQMLSDPWSGVYFYRITNNGSPVGLFANRNHQALFLAMMLPMIAAACLRGKLTSSRSIAAATAGIVLLPIILIAGSRAGVIAAALALCSIPFLVSRSTAPAAKARSSAGVRLRRMPRLAVLASVAGIGLIALTIAMGRDRAWERLSETRVEDELRWTIIPTVIDMIGKYFPVGTGSGSFERIFRADEPDVLLGPGYMQHAHNDWLDALLTGGVIAAVFLGVAVVAWFLRFGQLIVRRPQNDGAGRLSILGLTLVGLMGLSSFVDYPLRVPSLACLFVLAAVWAGGWRLRDGDSDALRGPEAANHPAGLRGTV